MKIEPQPDQSLNQFLDFLAQDIALRPGAVYPINSLVAGCSQALVEDVEIDIDKPLPVADE